MGDEVGGHHVSGHVHTTAQVRAVGAADANNRKLTFEVPVLWIPADAPQVSPLPGVSTDAAIASDSMGPIMADVSVCCGCTVGSAGCAGGVLT